VVRGHGFARARDCLCAETGIAGAGHGEERCLPSVLANSVLSTVPLSRCGRVSRGYRWLALPGFSASIVWKLHGSEAFAAVLSLEVGEFVALLKIMQLSELVSAKALTRCWMWSLLERPSAFIAFFGF
jgi:hypothetical protein